MEGALAPLIGGQSGISIKEWSFKRGRGYISSLPCEGHHIDCFLLFLSFFLSFSWNNCREVLKYRHGCWLRQRGRLILVRSLMTRRKIETTCWTDRTMDAFNFSLRWIIQLETCGTFKLIDTTPKCRVNEWNSFGSAVRECPFKQDRPILAPKIVQISRRSTTRWSQKMFAQLSIHRPYRWLGTDSRLTCYRTTLPSFQHCGLPVPQSLLR